MGNTLNVSFVTIFFTIEFHFPQKNSRNLVAHLIISTKLTLYPRFLLTFSRNKYNNTKFYNEEFLPVTAYYLHYSNGENRGTLVLRIKNSFNCIFVYQNC